MNLDDLFPKSNGPDEYVYSYTDGSNNTYYVTNTQVIYDPMDPMFSNTGTYSGGPPAEGSITESQFQEFSTIVDQVIRQKEDHLDNRPKGSGTLFLSQIGKTYVFGMHTDSKKAVEAKLKTFLGKE